VGSLEFVGERVPHTALDMLFDGQRAGGVLPSLLLCDIPQGSDNGSVHAQGAMNPANPMAFAEPCDDVLKFRHCSSPWHTTS